MGDHTMAAPQASSAITVMHVVFSLEAGGTEIVLSRVANHLDSRLWKVHVCCLERRGSIADSMPDPQSVYVLDKNPGKSWITSFRLMKLIARVKPDVLHTHNLGPLVYGVLGSCWGFSCPILHGEHGQLVDADLLPARIRLRKLLYSGVRRVHTVSAGQRTQLIALGVSPTKITAVINGVDTARFNVGDKPSARTLFHVPPAAPVIGIVGRLSPNKRHRLLIDAVCLLRPVLPNLQLLIAGDGPERQRLETAVTEAGLGEQVHFLGFLADPRSCFAAMDLLVTPSRQEGLSNAVLEAMACGVPVLAHTACGNAEVISDGRDGWLAALDSAERLAERILFCLNNREALQAAGQSARQTIQTRFNFNRTVQGYEALYREIAGLA